MVELQHLSVCNTLESASAVFEFSSCTKIFLNSDFIDRISLWNKGEKEPLKAQTEKNMNRNIQ